MQEQKKSIEIECPECKMKFRLWVPTKLFSQWKGGATIGCITCRAQIRLEPDNDTFHAVPAQQRERTKEAFVEKTAGTVPAKGESILVVDDDPLARRMTEDVLKKNKLIPVSAKNGVEALKLVEKKPIALVIVDLHLKNPKDPQSTMDGEEFLQRLAKLEKNIPSIVTTGKELVGDIMLEPKWYDLHVKGFIQKGSPFWTDELMAKIKETLKKD